MDALDYNYSSVGSTPTKTNMYFLYSYSETHARSCWELIFVCQKY